jgi:hypothetical protein
MHYKLKQLTKTLNQLQIPYQILSSKQIIIQPQTSPQFEIIPQTKTIYLNDHIYIYLNTKKPYNKKYLNKFLKYTITQINQITSKI